jgi:hypothetical protein
MKLAATTKGTFMTRQNKTILILLASLLAVALGLWATRFRNVPQLPANDLVFRTVDGLFTAVTARDEKRLLACQERLSDYQRSGELPAAAGKQLDKIVALAQSGDWELAAKRLYDFMQQQRREGPLVVSAGRKAAAKASPQSSRPEQQKLPGAVLAGR